MRLIDISKSFDNKEVLRNFSYDFKNGSRTCIMGASGSGKTTLLNVIMSLVDADSGEILDRFSDIAAVFQEDRLCEPYSAVHNVFAVTGKAVPESDVVALLGELANLDGSYYLVEYTDGQGVTQTGYIPTSYVTSFNRSEERRVGKECRSRWSPYH